MFALAALSSAGYLIRMDMVLGVLVCLAFVGIELRRERRSLRPVVVAIAALLATAVAYQVFRQGYFGDPLPNTYYLKMTGLPWHFRALRGLMWFGEFALPLWLPLLAMASAVALLAPKNRRYCLLAALCGVYFGYSIWVGGDAWEPHNIGANRFVAFIVPLVFVSLEGGLYALLDELRPRLAGVLAWRGLERTAAATIACFLLLAFNGLIGNPARTAKLRSILLLDRPLLVTSNSLVLGEVLSLKQQYPPGTRVATCWAGVPAFFTEFRLIDCLGYNDRHIARQRVRDLVTLDQLKDYIPGHGKRDIDYVLDVRKPDVIYQLWGLPDADLANILERKGYRRDGQFWVLATFKPAA